MNKFLFFLIFFTFFISIQDVIAQCVTPVNYADSVFGVWPDTIQNLPSATKNQPYLTTMYFKSPTNVRDLDPSLPSITVDSFKLSDIAGLPAGFTYKCDNNRCKWNGGETGCVEIQGTPTLENTYELTLKSIGYGFLFSSISAPYDFDGYRIIVDKEVGIKKNEPHNLVISSNFPNPFSDKSTIQINSTNSYKLDFYIIDITGKLIKKDIIYITPGLNKYTINENLNFGMYFYQFYESGSIVFSGKMTVIN